MHELINDLKMLCTNSDDFWSVFLKNIIGDNGYKHDVLMNTSVFKCPLNQLTDTNLIENCAKMFDCHFSNVESYTKTLDDSHQPTPIKLC